MDGGFTIPIALHPGIKPDDSDGDLTRAPNRPRPTSRADFGDKTPPGAPPVIAGTLRAVLVAAPLPENSGYHGGDVGSDAETASFVPDPVRLLAIGPGARPAVL
jgi:hypothetical protein